MLTWLRNIIWWLLKNPHLVCLESQKGFDTPSFFPFVFPSRILPHKCHWAQPYFSNDKWCHRPFRNNVINFEDPPPPLFPVFSNIYMAVQCPYMDIGQPATFVLYLRSRYIDWLVDDSIMCQRNTSRVLGHPFFPITMVSPFCGLVARLELAGLYRICHCIPPSQTALAPNAKVYANAMSPTWYFTATLVLCTFATVAMLKLVCSWHIFRKCPFLAKG